MAVISLKELMIKARNEHYALGAFNIINHLTTKAVIDACEIAKSPVIIQMSVKTVKQIGIKNTIDSILPMIKEASISTTLHLDHCTDVEFAKECIDNGFPSIMIDASMEKIEDNIRITNDVKNYGRLKNVDIEGEIGTIVGLEDHIDISEAKSSLADVSQAERYVKETDIDALAPAIGTAHGQYKGEPNIDFNRFTNIRDVCSCPLVIHGGTGLSDDTFRQLIRLGASKINISTALKMSYLSSIKEFLKDNPDETNPLKLDNAVSVGIMDMVNKHIELFGSVGKEKNGQ